jgi:pyridoxal phosphate-dependent aminotransferase EpsN
VKRRREINAAYRVAFAELPGIGFLPNAPDGEPTNWLTVITLDDPTPVREHLESLDIEARPAWKPMHLQPVFADCEMRGGAVAAEIFRHGLCPPSGSAMTDDDVARVVHGVREVTT